jgi:hypothetical protein
MNKLLQAVIVPMILLLLTVSSGCSMATVKESYEKTPARMESTGEGYTEYLQYTGSDGVIHLTPVTVGGGAK